MPSDFDYGNVLDRGEHGPAQDPRLVNSNYALINDMTQMERGNSPQRPIVVNPTEYERSRDPEESKTAKREDPEQ